MNSERKSKKNSHSWISNVSEWKLDIQIYVCIENSCYDSWRWKLINKDLLCGWIPLVCDSYGLDETIMKSSSKICQYTRLRMQTTKAELTKEFPVSAFLFNLLRKSDITRWILTKKNIYIWKKIKPVRSQNRLKYL